MINFSELRLELNDQYSEEILRIVKIYCELRNLPIEERNRLQEENDALIFNLTNECKSENLKPYLFNIFIYLQAQRSLHKEIDLYFSHFNYWSWLDWISYDIDSFFRNFSNAKAGLNFEKTKIYLNEKYSLTEVDWLNIERISRSSEVPLWDQISKFVDIERVKLNSQYSAPHPTWTHCVEKSENQVSDDYYNNRLQSQKKKPIQKIIDLQAYKRIWNDAKKSQDVVLSRITQLESLEALGLQKKVSESMVTDYDFFLFLFKCLGNREELMKVIRNVLK